MSKRRWSSYKDYEGGNFGYRFNMTRENWIEQCHYWSMDMVEDEENEYLKSLHSMDDKTLMQYIEDTWSIAIRETTWLYCDGKCYWKDPEGLTSGIYTIMDIRLEDDELFEDTILLLSNGYSEVEAPFMECYGLTEKKCPKCGKPLFVSDLGGYDYVCLDCDENFDEYEL